MRGGRRGNLSRGGAGRWALSWARPLFWVRLLVTLVLLAFGGRVSVAFASPCSLDHEAVGHDVADGESERASSGDGCCPDERSDREVDRKRGGEDHEGCSCPIDCGPCCGTALLHALPSVSPPISAGFTAFVELPSACPCTAPREADASDILHVPLPR